MRIGFVGDIHGQDEGLLRLTNEHIPTHDLIIQVGDFGMGFQNNCKNFLTQTDPNKFKVIAGNHDNPTELATYPHCLGDFGVYEFGGKKIFFVRGAKSIDKLSQMVKGTFWENEELSTVEGWKALDLWDEVCHEVDCVVSHDCPERVSWLHNKKHDDNSSTRKLLQAMFEIHQPPRRYYGHWHTNKAELLDGTQFQCVYVGDCATWEF